MIRFLISILIIQIPLSIYGQDDWATRHQDSLRKLWSNPKLNFPQKKFSKVVGYTFNKGKSSIASGEDSEIYDGKAKTFAKSKSQTSYPLTKQQSDTLLQILNDTTSFEWGQSGCFLPHHAFIFYNAKGKPIAWIDIGFECSQIGATPYSPKMKWRGLSSIGYTRIYNFCQRLGMPMDLDTN
jgi:hypothetical protein